MSSPTQIQIFGMRCSGTNYLEQLLATNLIGANIQWDFGWKHFFHDGSVRPSDHCLFVVIYRDPFDWLLSLCNKPSHAAPELKRAAFPKFIRTEWRSIWDERSGVGKSDPRYNTEMLCERDPENGQRFRNAMRLRSAKIRNWESLRDKYQHTHYINYEALLANPKQCIDDIMHKFNLRKTAKFNGVGSYKGKNKRSFTPLSYPSIRARDIDHIISELDADLEMRVGYNLAALSTQRRLQAQARNTFFETVLTNWIPRKLR